MSGTLHDGVLLLPAKLNRHIRSLVERNDIRLLGQPKRYRYYTNALQCYNIHLLPVLLLFVYSYCLH